MLREDQAELIGFLAPPAPHGGLPVERIETHTAVVFLAGSRALKLSVLSATTTLGLEGSSTGLWRWHVSISISCWTVAGRRLHQCRLDHGLSDTRQCRRAGCRGWAERRRRRRVRARGRSTVGRARCRDIRRAVPGVWLDAAEETRRARSRARPDDMSDADEDVVQRQVTPGAGRVTWCRVDAMADPREVAAAARMAVGQLAPVSP